MNERTIAVLVSVVCFCVYLTTMCRTVSFIDAGELATVAAVLGIAHPTGYPLFTLLSHCVLLIPFGGEEVLRLNIFSSFVVAVSVGVFFSLVLELVRPADDPSRKGLQRGQRTKPATLVAAALASLVFGFSTTVWAQSVAIEVYGLHLLLVLLTVLMFLKGVRENAAGHDHIPPRLVLSVFLLGLSFANHLTTLLLVPALVYLYAKSCGLSRRSARQALKLLWFFLLGLTPYLFLPVRAAAHPPLDWGYPVEAERLLWHISGKQYRSWMFSSFDSAEKQLTYFVGHFSSEFNWLVIAVLLIGVWKSIRLNRTVFWFLVIAFLSCLFYSINYDIHDIDSYFLLAYVVAAVFVFYGMDALLRFVSTSRSTSALFLSSLLLVLLPAGQLMLDRKEVSEADNYLTEDYTHNIFANTEPNALILSYQWDYFVAPSLYFQIVRKERSDLVIVDKELLRRSWYYVQLKDRYPWLIERSQSEVDAFLAELYKFEHDLPYNPGVIEARYVEMINSFIDQSARDRPVYVGPEIEPEFGREFLRLPEGLLFRLARTDTGAVWPVRIEYRPASIDTRLTGALRGLYAKMLTLTGARFLMKNRPSDALYCVERVLLIDPTYAPARTIAEKLRQSGPPAKP